MFLVAARSTVPIPSITQTCQSERRRRAQNIATSGAPELQQAVARQLDSLESQEQDAIAERSDGPEDVVYLMHRHDDGSLAGGGGTPVSLILKRGFMSVEYTTAANSSTPGGLITALVPDGVASVRLELSSRTKASRSGPETEVFAATAGDNVATARFPTAIEEPVIRRQTWLDSQGQVIKTIKGSAG